MFSKLGRTVLAFSVAFSPLSATASDQYFFRYKAAVQPASVVPPIDETEYGVGNDIVAYYVAPIGYAFSKRIPVATQDVVEWRKDSGTAPTGISLDVAAGVFSGQPTEEGLGEALYHGYDRAGNRIARAEIHFTVFEPVGAPALVDFYAHTGTYFYGEIPNPEGVTVHTWTPVADHAPGMSMMNSAFQGTPTKAGTYGLAWRGFDYLGREVAFAYGDLLVEDGPTVEEVAGADVRRVFADQTVDKGLGGTFSVTPTVRKSLGAVTYRLVPETARPSGLTFSSATGVVGGVYDDFETSAKFRIEARDSYDGTTGRSNAFSLTTLPAAADLSTLGNLAGVVNSVFYQRLTAGSVAPGASWALLAGTLPDGLSLDPATGIISGTPVKAGTSEGLVFGVSGPGTTATQSASVSFRVYSEHLSLSTEILHVRTNTSFTTKGVTVSTGGAGALSISGANLRPGLSVDASTGAVTSSGIAEAGYYDTILRVANEDRVSHVWQQLRVYNPLQIAYGNIEVTRHEWTSTYPAIPDFSVIGDTRFAIAGADGGPAVLPDWLTFSTLTGRLVGKPTALGTANLTHGPYVITVTDAQTSVPSLPFTVRVNERPAVELAVDTSGVQRHVENGYRLAVASNAYGPVTYSVVTKPANWPDTLGVTADGWLLGTTTDPAGTVYSGLVVKAVDGEGFEKQSDPVDVTVREPDALAPLYGSLDQTVEWTEGQPMAASLPQLGNAFGATAYAFSDPSEGLALTDAATGAYAGMAPAAGTYAIAYTIKDDTVRAPATGTLTLKVNPKLEVSADDVELNRAAAFHRAAPTVTGGTAPFTYQMQGTLPAGVSFDNGVLSGTPSAEGTFPVTVTVTDRTRAAEVSSFDIKVGPPLPVSLSYPEGAFVLGSWGTKFADLRNALPDVTWDPVAGDLPPGVSLHPSFGWFWGVPTAAGRWKDIRVSGRDGENRPFSATLDIVVTRGGDVGFADATFKHRRGVPFTDMLTADNVVAPVTYTAPNGTPGNIVLNGTTGSVSGSFADEGAYSFAVTASDDMARSAGATVTYEIVGDLSITYGDVTVKQYLPSDAPAATAANAVGTVAYSLASGTLPAGLSVDASTGAIAGTSDEHGTFANVVIRGTDVDGAADDSEPFTVTVTPREPLVLETPPALSLKRFGEASFAATTTDAIPPVAYDVTPDLPAGLALDTTTGAISGSSDEVVAETVYTLKAVDSKGGELGTDVAQFSLSVAERDQLVVSMEDVSAKRYTPISPVAANVTAGTAIGDVVYSIEPDLPAGLDFDPLTGSITGTPDDVFPSAQFTVTAVDSKGGSLGTGTATFTLNVSERDQLVISMGDMSAKRHTPMTPVAATVTAGTAIGAVSYSISPPLPAGLDFDPMTGTISGTPDDVFAASEFTVTAVDSKGGTLGTGSAMFTLAVADRDPLEIDGPESFEFPQHFEDSVAYAPVNAIGAATFSISPSLPEGLELDTATGVISGTAAQKAGPAPYTLAVTDAHDTVVKTVTLAVGDRKALEFVTSEAQGAILDHDYSLALEVGNAVGDVAWQHVSGDLPAGISFDAATGTFSGIPTAFGLVSTVTIRATDAFGGLTDRTFTFTVLQDGTPISLSAADVITRVGQPFAGQPVAANVVGNPAWTVQSGTTGLVVDAKTGRLSGTPSSAFDEAATIKVADPTGREASQTIRVVSAPLLTVTAPSVIDATFNYAIPPENNPVVGNAVGAVTWTVSGTLPQGLSFDTATGTFSGKPLEVGKFGPVTITASDTLPGTTSKTFVVKVVMNGDPIELAVTDFVTKIGKPVQSAAPAYGNNLGPVTFFSTDLAGTGLALDPATGVLSGTAAALTDVFVNVSVRDLDTLRVTSRPLRYQVIPDMQITLPAQVTISALTDIAPIAPTRNYVVGAATWEELDQSASKLPEGVTFDTATGTFVGNATEIGTFGPFTVASTDAVGDRGVSNSFVIRSNPGALFLGLAAAQLPDAVKRTEAYSYDVKQHLTNVGMDESEIAWALGAGSPPGLAIANGVISGTPALSGTYTFEVTASYGGITAKRAYTVVVKLPEIALELADASLPDAKRRRTGADNAYSFDLKAATTRQNIPADRVAYSLEPPATGESFPAGLSVGADGVVSGTADVPAGTHTFSVRASFTDATDETISSVRSYTIKVIDEIGFAFNDAVLSAGKKRLAYSFDLASLIDPASLKAVVVSDLAWSWSVDPDRDPDATRDDLAAGLSIVGGSVSGTPVNSGTYAFVLKAGFDGREISRAFTLQVGLQEISMTLGDATLPDSATRQAYNHDFGSLATVGGVNKEDVRWSSAPAASLGQDETAGLPTGLTLDPITGILSGEPTTPGKFRFDVTASWSDTNAVAETLSATKAYTISVTGLGFVQISAGTGFSCGVTTAGGAKCWGGNAAGRLGTGDTDYRPIPDNVVGLTSGVVKVVAGQNHACALTTAGGVKCWGQNTSGQLGRGWAGSSTNALAEDVVGLNSGVSDIALGAQHTCAILTSGEARCWGQNNTGQLGIGDKNDNSVPVSIPGYSFKSITAGIQHTCAVTTDNGAKCWGQASAGRLGNRVATGTYTSPVDVYGLETGVASISAGSHHTCAVTTNGGAKCWGQGMYGKLGYGTNPPDSDQTQPRDVYGLTSGVLSIGGGSAQSCALTVSGQVLCWGRSVIQQNVNSMRPVVIEGLEAGINTIGVGAAHNCAITTDNQAKCWGDNTQRQLGAGNITLPNNFSATPLNVAN